MRLRTKLLVGILITMLLQMAVTGTITLTTFLVNTRSARETDLAADWDRARSYIEELKHDLYTDLHQLGFLLGPEQTAGATPGRLREIVGYFISLTSADRIVLIDDPGPIAVDERSGIGSTADELPMAFVRPQEFRFPRNQFISVKDAGSTANLYLVTGTTIPLPGGSARHIYLITNIDKSMTEAIRVKTGTEVAFYVGPYPIASSTVQPDASGNGAVASLGDASRGLLSRPLSADLPDGVFLVAFRSLLPERMYVRSVLLSYLSAFLVTLVASLFVAAGITSLTVSPFTRLSHWLHRYMDSGEVGKLDIRSRDEAGFLAEAFHGMVSALIEEKRVIADQLEQISVLHTYNERIMESIQAGIVLTDPSGVVEFCNGYLAELIGLPVETVRGSSLRAIMERSSALRSSTELAEAIGAGTDAVVEGLKLTHPDGSAHHFTAKISPIELSGSRRGSLLVLEDVTTAERLWARMTIADKVTSLGLLSAGMAHEINNPLGAILSHVNYLKAVEGESDKLDSLTWIESETNRIAAIVARIRAYTAPSPRQCLADLNAVTSETAEVLRYMLEKRSLRLSLDLGQAMAPVRCPADELKQVALNIVLNACEACADGGVIAVATRCDGEGRATLTVKDNGVGIAPVDMKNIFDPFFTTKGAQQGNGLGLSICYAIVKRAGGDIHVASVPLKGTEVEVVLLCT